MAKKKAEVEEAPMKIVGDPCKRCLYELRRGTIVREAVRWLDPVKAMNPIARAGFQGYVCRDCAAADLLQIISENVTFGMARRAIAEDRLEELRAPGISGMAQRGIFRPSEPGELEAVHTWLEANGIE